MENKYEKHLELLKTDRNEFNLLVYNDIDVRLDNMKIINDIISLCASENALADELYIKEYPSSKDFIDVLKLHVDKILTYMVNKSVIEIVRTSLDGIEFIISSDALTDYHIRRHLLPVMKIKDLALFKLPEDIEKRLIALFNTQISIVRHSSEYQVLFGTFNSLSLESYLKLQKIDFETELVNGAIDNDYEIKRISYNKNPKNLIKLTESYKNATTDINQIDVFRLNNNGFDSIKNIKYDGNEYKIYLKEDKQFVIMKSNKDKDLYYLIGESVNYKIKLKHKQPVDDKVMDVIIESAFCNIVDKKNGR